MGVVKSVQRQLNELRRDQEALTAALCRQEALLAYTAMMSDVELPEDEEETYDE